MNFNDWCTSVDETIGSHHCRVMTAQGRSEPSDCDPGNCGHCADALCIGRASRASTGTAWQTGSGCANSGQASDYKGDPFRRSRRIYATEWIDAHSGGYRAPIKRLRWKDHRNMAMRGDDVIGIFQDPQTQRLHFLKTEAKSRVALNAQILTEARAALDKDGGLPSAHALSFISARLLELNQLPLADAIDDALLKHGIPPQNVRHLLFAFSGNAPDALLAASLQAYPGPITLWGVGLRVDGHAAFIGACL